MVDDTITIQGDIAEDIVFINIMQELVLEKMDKYVSMFGVCSCARCKQDIMALSLSRLSAKYVVLKKDIMRPMMSFYASKYDTMVTAQVIFACKAVMENPRH